MGRVDERVHAMRHFNRFYTRQIGALQEGLLNSRFSLTELRVLYELAHWPDAREQATATGLRQELGLDAGYLSRILGGFKRRGLIASKSAQKDGRQSNLALTAKGRSAFTPLDARSHAEVAAMLKKLPPSKQIRLIGAMHAIEELLGGEAEITPQAPYLLRRHKPGDMGWIIQRHGALYAQEYGWDASFEALVADIAARFIRMYDPKSERCWMAERDGEIVGSVMLVRKSKTTAQLRLLLVEPKARGIGLGARLVGECERFARQAGYRKIMLWTNSILHAARHIYQRAGYRLVREEPHHSFGHDLVGQIWELKL